MRLQFPSWQQVRAFHHSRCYYAVFFIVMAAFATWVIASCGLYTELALTFGLFIATGMTIGQYNMSTRRADQPANKIYIGGTGAVIILASAAPMILAPNILSKFIAWGISLVIIMPIWHFTAPRIARWLR